VTRRAAVLALLPLLVPSTAALAQVSPYLPEKGQFVLTPGFNFQTYDRFWLGTDKQDFPTTDQILANATSEYGLLRDLALDLTLGYTRTTGTRPEAGADSGLDDTTFGLRWRPVDEFRFDSPLVPTLAFRVGGIIEGTYHEGLAESPGDGASGYEASLLIGKSILDTGLGVVGLVGYRDRTEGVPSDLLASAGAYYVLLERISLSFGYQLVKGLSGNDIGDPGFEFPQVREISHTLQAGLGFIDNAGRQYNLYFAWVIAGRNTAQKQVYGFNIVFPFGGRVEAPDPFGGTAAGY
jgi:hypothetical protein